MGLIACRVMFSKKKTLTLGFQRFRYVFEPLLISTYIFRFEFYSCDLQGDVHFLRTKNKAVRFRFVIQNFFGEMGQNLYLHCKITTCERKYAPQPTIFNCHTHGEYCPNKKEEEITTGPFFVWPVVSRRDRTRQEMPATSKYLRPSSRGGGGILYNGLYGEAPPESGTFFKLQVYKRVGISRVEVKKTTGKTVIGY